MRRALLLLIALLPALAPVARAQGDSIKIRTYAADLVVHRDGATDVTETIHFAFYGPWNGILRDLSLQHRNGDGRTEKLKVEVQGVATPSGQPYRWQEEDADGDDMLKRLRIWIPDARDAERILVIRYRVKNAVRFFYADSAAGNFDELYWNVTGNDWTMPIQQARARVILPDGVVPRQQAAYVGYEGSAEQGADVEAGSGIVTFATRRELAPGEGLTVAVGWPAGAIAGRPSAAAHSRAETARKWPLGLPLLAFFFSFRAWRRRGRDPKELPVVVGYEPPEGMTPAEIGTLVDHRVHMQDVTATLVDLAVRGYLGIEERKEKRFLGLFSDTEYVFHLRRPREEWGALLPHERKFLNALFTAASTADQPWEVIKAVFAEARQAQAAGREFDRGAFQERMTQTAAAPAESVKLSDLTNRFYRSLPGIREAVYERLKERGYYRDRPDQVLANWTGVGTVLGILSVFGAVFGAGMALGWVEPWALAAGGIASALLVVGFGFAMPARTVAGARAREAALGFREFLDKVESDRYRRMVTGPEMFERYLPYAMAFGVEARWAKAFDDLYREPPDWYSGSGYGSGFRASSFTQGMSSLSSRAGSTMSSSPSSSGSGSGGGGSSGGGSGGGGGSGF
ncbi:MAG TPA: DUF2207 domain-containing protein [Longimicrobium sp.]|jgi:uncharacterized membrane protein YgcG